MVLSRSFAFAQDFAWRPSHPCKPKPGLLGTPDQTPPKRLKMYYFLPRFRLIFIDIKRVFSPILQTARPRAASGGRKQY